MHLFLQYQPNNHYISYTLVVVIFTCINYANWLVTIIVAVLSQHLLWHCHAIATASVAMLPCYRYCYRRCTSATSVAMLLLLIPLLRYRHLSCYATIIVAMLPPHLLWCSLATATTTAAVLLPHLLRYCHATAIATAAALQPHQLQCYCYRCYHCCASAATSVATLLLLLRYFHHWCWRRC